MAPSLYIQPLKLRGALAETPAKMLVMCLHCIGMKMALILLQYCYNFDEQKMKLERKEIHERGILLLLLLCQS